MTPNTNNTYIMRRTILFLVCLMGMTFAFAQGNMQDVVYLKNGSIIRGEIIEMVSGETVKIMTVDGCLFVWDMDEVERITQEEMLNRESPQRAPLPHSPNITYHVR